MLTNHSKWIFFASLSLLIFLVAFLIWDIATPKPLVIDEQIKDAEIYFSSQQDAIFLAAGCVDIEWRTENINAVYLNGNGTTGAGQENLCFQVARPRLRIVFRDETVQVFTLPIRTFSNDPLTLSFLLLSTLLLILACLTSPIQAIRNTSQSLALRLGQHLRTKTLSPQDFWLARAFGYLFSFLNLVFVLSLLFNFGSMPVTLAYIAVGCLGIGLGLWSSFQRLFGSLIQLRWAILLPFIWFILTTSIHASTPIELTTFASITSWETTIFFCLLVYWGIVYIQRSFPFTKVRKFAWLSIFVLFSIVAVLSLSWPLLNFNEIHPRCSTLTPDQLWYYYCSTAPDSSEYVKYTQDFPESLKVIGIIIHRPVFSLLSAQICTLIDIPLHGYSAPYRGCSSYDTAVIAIWLTNFAFGLISLFIVYELLCLFSKDSYQAWLAAIFATISPFHIWYFALPTTDYSEIFLSTMGLWLAYRLFSEKDVPLSRAITYGIVLLLMLLIKLNAIVYIFLTFMVLITRRWRLIPIFTVLPFGLFMAYTQFIPLWGIPYMTAETGSHWSTVRWLWLEWIYMSPPDMWHHVVIWFGHTAFQVAVLYGALLLIAIFTFLYNAALMQKWMFIGCLLFLSSTIFAFVARLSYTSHVLNLMPIIYGLTALGVIQMKDYLATKIQARPLRLALQLLVLALPIIQLLFLWLALGGQRMNSFVILLSGA